MEKYKLLNTYVNNLDMHETSKGQTTRLSLKPFLVHT